MAVPSELIRIDDAYMACFTQYNPETGCHEWIGSKWERNYGKIVRHEDGEKFYYRAHRVAYCLEHDLPYDGDFFVLHTCDNPCCVDPAHLYAGTHEDNMKDKVERNRQVWGDKCHNATLKPEQVLQIRSLLEQGFSAASIGRMFNVTHTAILNIKHGDTWSNLK